MTIRLEHSQRPDALRLAGVVGIALFLLAGCLADVGPEPASQRRDAIVNGELDETHGAVVALRRGQWGATFCSGTLIAPRIVLTAAHCLPPHIDPTAVEDFTDIRVFFGPDQSGEGESIEVTEGWTHEDYGEESWAWDLGLLRIEREGPVTPIPLHIEPVEPDAPVLVVGYGITSTEGSDSGIRRRGDARVTHVRERELVLTADPANTCFGDSGGPTLIDIDGTERVVGVHSRLAGGGCGVRSTDIRVDIYARDLARFVLALAPTCAAGDGCVEGCATPDPDCLCEADGHCDGLCPDPERDPDCLANCDENSACNPTCGGTDPDCPCSANQVCERECDADPDCVETRDPCARDGYCETDCPSDADCDAPREPCIADGLCDRACLFDPDCPRLDVNGGGCSSVAGQRNGRSLTGLLFSLRGSLRIKRHQQPAARRAPGGGRNGPPREPRR